MWISWWKIVCLRCTSPRAKVRWESPNSSSATSVTSTSSQGSVYGITVVSDGGSKHNASTFKNYCAMLNFPFPLLSIFSIDLFLYYRTDYTDSAQRLYWYKCVRLSRLLAFECTLNHCTFIHSFSCFSLSSPSQSLLFLYQFAPHELCPINPAGTPNQIRCILNLK